MLVFWWASYACVSLEFLWHVFKIYSKKSAKLRHILMKVKINVWSHLYVISLSWSRVHRCDLMMVGNGSTLCTWLCLEGFGSKINSCTGVWLMTCVSDRDKGVQRKTSQEKPLTSCLHTTLSVDWVELVAIVQSYICTHIHPKLIFAMTFWSFLFLLIHFFFHVPELFDIVSLIKLLFFSCISSIYSLWSLLSSHSPHFSAFPLASLSPQPW